MKTIEIAKVIDKRNIFFTFFNIVVLFIFFVPFMELFPHSLREELNSYVVLIPFISGYLIFLKRKEIYPEMEYSFKTGTIVLILGILLYLFADKQRMGLSQSDHLSLVMLSALTFWIGGFVFFYGVEAFKTASFALFFLLFTIPIPNRILEVVIPLLQSGSAEAAYGFFKLTGVPILREGFIFHLPGMSIEVAKQCSGIRSSIALLITSIIAGHLFLRTGWKKLVLVLSIFPITVLKNGLRIATLCLLGAYIDPRILSGDLHKRGGIPFFIVALAFLAPILFWLRRSERKR